MSINVIWTSGWGMILNYLTVHTSTSRPEIELACEEIILGHGPEALLGLLLNNDASVRLLKEEYDSMEERQAPSEGGTPRAPTLIATLKQALAAKLGCEIQHNKVLMWDVLDSECADIEDDAKSIEVIDKLVNGQALMI